MTLIGALSFISLLNGIWAGIIVVLLFGLAIFIHELGHFLAARKLGFRVDAFALGFGPAIWKKKIGETVYKICIIPFGGYVALPQLDPSGMDKLQGNNEDNEKQSGDDAITSNKPLAEIAPWKKIIVSVAGPFGNVVLAAILAWIIWMAPSSFTGGTGTIIGTVEQDSQAWEAGVRAGQKILRVNNTEIRSWFDFIVECHLSSDGTTGVSVVLQDGNNQREVILYPTQSGDDLRFVKGLSPQTQCYVQAVKVNSPAEGGGIKKGDFILKMDGLSILSMSQFVEKVSAYGEKPMALEILRDKETVSLSITPQFNREENRSMIGVELRDAIHNVPVWMQYSNPFRQLQADASSVLRILRAFFLPKTQGETKRAAASVGGPLLIMVKLWDTVRESFISSLGFLRCICVNLAIINLLPFPVLDGGHIMFALWEIVTRRKPNFKVVNALVNAFAILLIGLMLLLVYRDGRRLYSERQRQHNNDTKNEMPDIDTAPVVEEGVP